MRTFRDLSIKRKLTWIIMLTSSIALLLACLAFITYDRFTFKSSMVRDLQILSQIIGANSTAAVIFDNEEDAAETLASLRAERQIVSAAIYDAGGRVFAKYHRNDRGFSPPPPRAESHEFSEEHLDLFSPIVIDGDRIGTVYIRSDLSQMQTRQVRYATLVVASLLAASLVAYLITARLQRVISQPILDLAAVANVVSVNRDYALRAPRTTRDEVGSLIQAFNDMLSQIQERDQALQRARDSLEARVEERTQDLRQANEQLRQEIADRKRTEAALLESEEQLRQSQKLEAIGRLAGGVAHDFNNQLAIIRGYVEMTLDDLHPETQIYTDLIQINKAVEKSIGLIDQLLMFSSKQPMNRRPIDLNRHIQDLQKMLGRLLGEDVIVDQNLESGLWTVNADPSNIDQVITNLTVNARDAMPGGGIVTIRTQNVSFTEIDARHHPEARPGRFIRLTVSDTGIGMTEDVLLRLFEPFFTTKAPGKGTGLGLSVVYGIVQSHEGWITVKSTLNQGSTFDIFLPAVEQDVQTGVPHDLPTSLDHLCGQGERVLLIEDEPALRDMTHRALSTRGYVVRACGTATEAVTAFHENVYDLILSDVVLPDGRGPDLVFDFLDERPDLAAILITGYTDERGEWERARQAGLDLLQKPVPMGKLLECVRESLDKKKPA